MLALNISPATDSLGVLEETTITPPPSCRPFFGGLVLTNGLKFYIPGEAIIGGLSGTAKMSHITRSMKGILVCSFHNNSETLKAVRHLDHIRMMRFWIRITA